MRPYNTPRRAKKRLPDTDGKPTRVTSTARQDLPSRPRKAKKRGTIEVTPKQNRAEVDCLVGDLPDADYAVFGRVVTSSEQLAELLRETLCLLPDNVEEAGTTALLDALEAVEDVALSMKHHFGHLCGARGPKGG